MDKAFNNKQTLEYILKTETFTMDDYIKLVSKDISKKTLNKVTIKYNNNCNEYLIPIIKFKFNLDVNITILKNSNIFWKDAIIKYFNFDINNISEYIQFINDYTLSKIIIKHKPNNISSDIIIKLIDKKYLKTIDVLFRKCSIIMNEELFEKIKKIKLPCKIGKGYGPFNSILVKLDIIFNTKELLFKFIEQYKYKYSNIIRFNRNLITREEYINFLIDKKIDAFLV